VDDAVAVMDYKDDTVVSQASTATSIAQKDTLISIAVDKSLRL